MTNRIVIGIVLVIVLVFAVDALALDGSLPVFMGRKAADLIEWIAFWR